MNGSNLKFNSNALLAIFLLISANCVFAGFEGTLELIPQGCERSGQCTLKNALRYTDPANIVWEAKANLVTDGASIPAIFQPFIGKPFDPSFIKAAVIHDHYCDRHVRPWRQTHHVFYDGLVYQGVPIAKAKIMYFAVYLGGPKWVNLIPGKYCGPNCVNKIVTTSGVRGVMARQADYSGKDLQAAVDNVAAVLERDANALSLSDLEARAKSIRPNDFYFNHGDSAPADEIGITQ